MKKRIAIITVVIILAITAIFMTACNKKGKQDVYATLDALVAKEHANVTVNVTTAKQGHTLKDKYVISASDGQSTITYTIEELNTFDLASGSVPENYKTVKTGVAKVKDGKVTEINGDETSVEFEKIGANEFVFKQEYFSNAVETTDGNGNDIFRADITDTAAFMQSKEVRNEAKIVVKYNKTTAELMSIELSYSTRSATSVQISYIFN